MILFAASKATASYRNGKICVTPPPSAPKITTLKHEAPYDSCYDYKSTVTNDISIQTFLPDESALQYVEVYKQHTSTCYMNVVGFKVT